MEIRGTDLTMVFPMPSETAQGVKPSGKLYAPGSLREKEVGQHNRTDERDSSQSGTRLIHLLLIIDH